MNSSTTSLLLHHNTPSNGRNYDAALSSLMSSYGFAGGVAAMPQKSHKSSKAPQLYPSHPPSFGSSAKNYEAAFGGLSSSFGFGGGVPVLPRKS
ncbi:uncharacterized protein LACBIDRAFT_319049 [Laccaria bicolor S238N-H82]|uniref:Predicted protein n=1 Tax=Laccaria bicolor (strain S238N-H82 / ATCC MYA-4686) TaxID=486041 RepID=B0D7R3_LACBS|nr:uncharacterized protein LACBIDRAFT_319049 [Laccaria bicolor S238N-H82]EDR09693.1 predicted protein [Laccaria bicolor S238N-H82]|eukprot:XP_001880042.1 predicted protein [Laccaria bicolor S238N-H82]